MSKETKQMLDEIEKEPASHQAIITSWIEVMWEGYVALCKEQGCFPSAYDFKEFLAGR